ncbi:hypothetical protein Q7P35_000770 [Cladosporium inversicolor]
MSSKTVYRPLPSLRRARRAPCSVIKTLRDAIEATKRQLLCGAASRQSRRVLAGLAPSQAQKLNASAARPRRHRKVEKVSQQWRDLQTIGSTEVWNSRISTDRRQRRSSANFAFQVLVKKRERESPRKRT